MTGVEPAALDSGIRPSSSFSLQPPNFGGVQKEALIRTGYIYAHMGS